MMLIALIQRHLLECFVQFAGSLRIVLVKVMRSLLLAWRRMLSSSFCFQQAFGRFLPLFHCSISEQVLQLQEGEGTAELLSHDGLGCLWHWPCLALSLLSFFDVSFAIWNIWKLLQ